MPTEENSLGYSRKILVGNFTRALIVLSPNSRDFSHNDGVLRKPRHINDNTKILAQECAQIQMLSVTHSSGGSRKASTHFNIYRLLIHMDRQSQRKHAARQAHKTQMNKA